MWYILSMEQTLSLLYVIIPFIYLIVLILVTALYIKLWKCCDAIKRIEQKLDKME